MRDLERILSFFHFVEKLKTVKRQVKISDNSRQESPAEHTWRVALMAMVLHRNLRLKLDLFRSIKMIIVHDVPEVIANDVWIADKDPKKNHQKAVKELKAAKKVFSELPERERKELLQLWLEFERSKSKEAKFARALDKLEVIVQRTDLQAKNWERAGIYEILEHWADESVAAFPQLLGFKELAVDEATKQVGKKG